MPAKVYLDSPPNGDFRAMPARGDGLALLKVDHLVPLQPRPGLPTVTGAVDLSVRRRHRRPADAVGRSLGDRAADRRSRRGGVPRTLAPTDARTVGIVGCGLHWRLGRALPARGRLRAGRLLRRDGGAAAERLAGEMAHGWRAGSREEAVAQEVV